MRIRKWFAALITLCIVLTAALAGADTHILMASDQVSKADDIGLQAGTVLTVGTATAMSGYFSTDLWGTNASDMDVRSLLHGCETVAPSPTQGMVVNSTAMVSIEEDAHDTGYYTYTLTLRDDLFYNDGSAITAEDYVFYFLLNGAPEIDAIGGNPLDFSYIEGFEAWHTGAAETVAGISLLSEHSFSMRIAHDALPYFYSLELLYAFPLPLSVIAPGCAVLDDGAGVYIGASGEALEGGDLPFAPGDFSAEMLAYTLLDAQNGYVYAPQVTSGPYALESFDLETSTAAFVANAFFPGNFEGQKPHIERLIYRQMDGAEMISMLEAGEVCLLNKVSDLDAITQGHALVEKGGVGETEYPRTGLTYLAFANEAPPLNSAAVRRAIALSLDIDGLVAGDESGVLKRVYGYYGLGQWMADYEDGDFSTPEALEGLRFEQDADAANALLDEEGWTLNAEGGPYAAGEGSVRHKLVDGVLTQLSLRWAKSIESRNADRVEAMLREALPAIGVALEVTEMPFTDMLAQYYRQGQRTYNTFFLGSSFNYYFDPYYYFNLESEFQGAENTTGLLDETLFDWSVDMRETEPSDLTGYAEKWLQFQARFTELMPVIPLYSSNYYDFYTSALQGYDIASHSNWAFAVVYAYLGGAGL